MASEIHKNDIGTRFLMTIKDDGNLVNISGSPGSSTHQVNIKKPDDVVVNRTAVLQDYGISGVMYYDSVAGDLDQAGTYKLQAKVVIPSGTYYTDVYTFKVHTNL